MQKILQTDEDSIFSFIYTACDVKFVLITKKIISLENHASYISWPAVITVPVASRGLRQLYLPIEAFLWSS